MSINRFLSVYTEEEIKAMGVQGYFDLRSKASKEEDLDTLLDIAFYRFYHGSDATNIDLLPELFYLCGKAQKVQQLQELLNEYGWALMTLPQDCIQRAKIMLALGLKFPNYNDMELNFLESIWCESNSYEMMDIIMYDEYLLPRSLKKFDKESLNKIHTDFSDEFLLKIYELFEVNEEEQNNPYCYDRKINDIRQIKWDKLGRGEYPIENSKSYNEMHNHLLETYGEECAHYFAEKLCFQMMSVEEFKESTFCSVNPWQVIRVAEDYFEDESKIIDLKKWFASDYLYTCNHPPKGWR